MLNKQRATDNINKNDNKDFLMGLSLKGLYTDFGFPP
jgi:hypothetical protein